MCANVQNLNLLQPKLRPVVQFTEQLANMFTDNADNKYACNNCNAITTWAYDHSRSAELKNKNFKLKKKFKFKKKRNPKFDK